MCTQRDRKIYGIRIFRGWGQYPVLQRVYLSLLLTGLVSCRQGILNLLRRVFPQLQDEVYKKVEDKERSVWWGWDFCIKDRTNSYLVYRKTEKECLFTFSFSQLSVMTTFMVEIFYNLYKFNKTTYFFNNLKKEELWVFLFFTDEQLPNYISVFYSRIDKYVID